MDKKSGQFADFIQATVRQGPDMQAFNIQDLRNKVIEANFDKFFQPHKDQVMYIREKQKEKFNKQQFKIWRRDRKEPTKTLRVENESYNRKKGNPDPVSEDSSSEDDAQGSTAVGQDTEPIGQFEESKGPDSTNSDQLFKASCQSYTSRCKTIGRIGPPYTELDASSMVGDAKLLIDPVTRQHYKSPTTAEPGLYLRIESENKFTSIRANTAVVKKQFYYEVMLLSSGLMQIGWSSLQSQFTRNEGVGDDAISYAFDGSRVKKWNGSSSEYGEQWSTGDVIGTLIDLKNGEISFWRNNKFLGVAFTNVSSGPNRAYFPAISLDKGQKAIFNFGLRPFDLRLPFTLVAMNEPDCMVNNYYYPSVFLLDRVKNYIIAFSDSKFNKVSEDEKLFVGGILLEYLLPMMEEPFIFESQIVYFFYELILIKKKELIETVLKTFELHCSAEQLCEWQTRMFSILVRRILHEQIGSKVGLNLSIGGGMMSGADDLNYLLLLEYLITRESFLAAVISSPTFDEEMEILFSVHLPTKQEWMRQLEVIYHELIPENNSKHDKIIFQTNYKQIQVQFERHFTSMIKITNSLLDQKNRVSVTTGLTKKEIVPFDRFVEFVAKITNKSVKLQRDNIGVNYMDGQAHELSNPSIQMGNILCKIFICLAQAPCGFNDQVLCHPLQDFPVYVYFLRESPDFDQVFKNKDRLGGTLSHLENELRPQIQAIKGSKMTEQQRKTLNFMKLIINIFNDGLMDLFKSLQTILDKIYIIHRQLDDIPPQYQNHSSSAFCTHSLEIRELVKKSLSLKMMFLNTAGKDSLLKIGTWLVALLNSIDAVSPEPEQSLVYCMPEFFADIPFEMFRVLKRANQDLYDANQLGQSQVYSGCLQGTTYQRHVARFIAKHFCDPKIPNPDLKEVMVIRFNMLLQYQQCINILEQDHYAQNNLATFIMRSMNDRRWMSHTIKNFLRLSKGRGFKEIVYRGSKGSDGGVKMDENGLSNDSTRSDFYLGKVRIELLKPESEMTKDFMNSIFNSLNDVTSELFMIFREETQANILNNKNNLLKQSKFYLDLIIDLCRIIEILSKYVPELFLSKETIHATRMLNFVTFVLKSVFQMEMDRLLTAFCKRSPSRGRTLGQLLAPFIGIFSNLYLAIPQLQNEDPKKFDNLQCFITRIDSFDLSLFHALLTCVLTEIPPLTQEEINVMETFGQILGDIDELISQKRVRLDSNDELAQEIASESLCQICFSRVQNAVYDPCEHTSCKTCIQMSLQNNKRCPFCNIEVTGFKQTSEEGPGKIAN